MGEDFYFINRWMGGHYDWPSEPPKNLVPFAGKLSPHQRRNRDQFGRSVRVTKVHKRHK